MTWTMTWNWHYAWSILPTLAAGLKITLEATGAATLVAAVVGLGLAIIRRAGGPFGALVAVVVEFLRGTPLLIQLFFLFYIAPRYGLTLSPFITGVIGLGAYYSAYFSEVYRGGIASVPQSQWDAATVLNLSPARTWMDVIVPQAFRAVIPALANYVIAMFKDTAILSTITISELLGRAELAGSTSYRYVEPFTIVGVLYFALSYPSSVIVRWLERRLRRVAPAHL